MNFGRRTAPVAANEIEAMNAKPRDPGAYPWSGEADYAACNFAVGHLAHNLKQRLVVDGRIHAETLIVAIGAIAGFCAQCAVSQGLIKSGGATLGQDFHIVVANDGSHYIFGDAIDSFLVPERPNRPSLWGFAAGAALVTGLANEALPSYEPLMASVAQSIGRYDFGLIEAGPHTPQMQPLEMLNLVWPLARKCLTGRGLGEREWGHASFMHWPAITGYVAASYINEMKDVLAPAIAVKLLMHAAIITSKVQPTTVVDGLF